jgi:pseudaminic acid biosynthesis-associated methylase
MLTEQEQFWSGEFGRSYTERNANLNWRARVPFWRDIIDRTKPTSILEVGCNIGSNMKAIRDVNPMISLWGCDINNAAIEEAGDAGLSVTEASLFDLKKGWPEGGFDLVATVGVLIHVSSEDLPRAMDSIISVSNRYVLAVEYADETEVEVAYRGHSERLWRRPFGRLYEERGLKLVAEFDAPADAFDRCRAFLCEKA